MNRGRRKEPPLVKVGLPQGEQSTVEAPELPGACPFCGSRKTAVKDLAAAPWWRAVVICDNCRAHGPVGKDSTSYAAARVAITLWNQRASK
jgi:hypothetical protein